MKTKMNLWMLGIAAMLASCSQNEEVLQGTNGDSDVVRITAQLADGMKTRATVDEDENESAGVNRYVLNAYEVTDGTETKADVTITDLGSGNFTAKLDRKKTYKFYCWADEGDNSSYTITDNDLKSITLKENAKPTIAHRGVSGEVSGASDQSVTIQLTHAVAKAVLQTTSDLGANTAKLSTKTYSTYDAIKGEVSGEKTDIESTNAEAASGASEDNPVEILQFYTLMGEKETLEAAISYTTTAGDFATANTYTKPFSNAPFQADYRTVFKGDIAGLQYSTASVTATLDGNWEDEYLQEFEATADKDNHLITTFDVGQIAANPDLIEEALADGSTELNVNGPLSAEDVTTIKEWLNAKEDKTIKYTLNLNDIEEIPADAFNGCTNVSTINMPNAKKIGDGAFKNMEKPILYLTYTGDMEIGDCFDSPFGGLASTHANEYTIYLSITQGGGANSYSPGLQPDGSNDGYTYYRWGNATIMNSWRKFV